MKKNQYNWAIQTAALFILAATASAQQNPGDAVYQDSTNRLSLSLRFGLNINAKFKGIGGSLNPARYDGFGRKTPDGAAYNYDNGYVLTDVSGNAGGETPNRGYGHHAQV